MLVKSKRQNVAVIYYVCKHGLGDPFKEMFFPIGEEHRGLNDMCLSLENSRYSAGTRFNSLCKSEQYLIPLE